MNETVQRYYTLMQADYLTKYELKFLVNSLTHKPDIIAVTSTEHGFLPDWAHFELAFLQ